MTSHMLTFALCAISSFSVLIAPSRDAHLTKSHKTPTNNFFIKISFYNILCGRSEAVNDGGVVELRDQPEGCSAAVIDDVGVVVADRLQQMLRHAGMVFHARTVERVGSVRRRVC